jgi:trehalose 6-phosphate phosphatase
MLQYQNRRMAEPPSPLSALDIAHFDPAKTAFFVDFDGTLAEIADDPAAVALDSRERQALTEIAGATDGAVAIISGRAVADLDRLLAPLVLPLAGVHGLERRAAAGALSRIPSDEAALGKAMQALRALERQHPGLLVEKKPGSVALHFRRRPELEPLCMATTTALVETHPSLQLLHGKMVIELKAGQATKADAIRDFMRESPFRGRTPLFAGDDATDECGFLAMPEFAGTSIKIGPGRTIANYRAETIEEFRAWLARLAARFGRLTTEGWSREQS